MDVVTPQQMARGLTYQFDDGDLLDVRIESGITPSVYVNGKLARPLVDPGPVFQRTARLLTVTSVLAAALMVAGMLVSILMPPLLVMVGGALALLALFAWQRYRWAFVWLLGTLVLLALSLIFFVLPLGLPLVGVVLLLVILYLVWGVSRLLLVNVLALVAVVLLSVTALNTYWSTLAGVNDWERFPFPTPAPTPAAMLPAPESTLDVATYIPAIAPLNEAYYSAAHEVIVVRTGTQLFVYDPRTHTVPNVIALDSRTRGVRVTRDGTHAVLFYDHAPYAESFGRADVFLLPNLLHTVTLDLGDNSRVDNAMNGIILTDTHLLYDPVPLNGENGGQNYRYRTVDLFNLEHGEIQGMSSAGDLSQFTLVSGAAANTAYGVHDGKLVQVEILTAPDGQPVAFSASHAAPSLNLTRSPAVSDTFTALVDSSNQLYVPSNALFTDAVLRPVPQVDEPIAAVAHHAATNTYAFVTAQAITFTTADTLTAMRALPMPPHVGTPKAFFDAAGTALIVLYENDRLVHAMHVGASAWRN